MAAGAAGRVPSAYDVDPQTGYLTPVPTEAPLVPVIFDRYAHGRDGAPALERRRLPSVAR